MLVVNKRKQYFSVQDAIYGFINLHPIAKYIIDTLPFQRMRNIKQLGISSFIYINGGYSRFEHLIGTAHLCSLVMDHLNRESDMADLITDQDCLCVMIAGLCHDLGHGPFSHVYEKLFPNHEWSHEAMSCRMFDHILKENVAVSQQFAKYGLTQNHIQLIKALIIGEDDKSPKNVPILSINNKEYKKLFLFEIVANKINSIDMDKFDYLARDCYYTGMKLNLNFTRFISNIHITTHNDMLRLCYSQKITFDINEIFQTRWNLYNRVYLQHTSRSLEIMILQILKKSDITFNFISQSSDPTFFETLDDSIINRIRVTTNPELEIPRKLIKRIFTRNLYKFCGKVLLKSNWNEFAEYSYRVWSKELISYIKEFYEYDLEGRVYLDLVETGYRKGRKDHPLESVMIFDNCSNELTSHSLKPISHLIPNNCQDELLLLFIDFDGFDTELVGGSIKKNLFGCFQSWCALKNISGAET